MISFLAVIEIDLYRVGFFGAKIMQSSTKATFLRYSASIIYNFIDNQQDGKSHFLLEICKTSIRSGSSKTWNPHFLKPQNGKFYAFSRSEHLLHISTTLY